MKKTLLLILDGFGLNYNKEQNPILSADTPTLNKLIYNHPFTALEAAGENVGLSWGEVGNSEVGHFNLGSGQILWQNLPKIDQSIEEGDFFKKEALLKTVSQVKENGTSLHLIGLVSDGGIHSHINHLFALLDLAAEYGIKKVYIHMITDGRDAPPQAAPKFLKQLENKISEVGLGRISTVTGRAWAMDRDDNWKEKTKPFYRALTGKTERSFDSAQEILEDNYQNQNSDDEKAPPAIVKVDDNQFLSDKDGVIIFNFRADRARQMTKAIGDPDLDEFDRDFFAQELAFATMTPYEEDWDMDIMTVFSPPKVDTPLTKVIADNNINQFHIAESEKKAHATYFFNGGNQEKYNGEMDTILPSPDVESYDRKPEMSLPKVSEKLVEAIDSDQYQFIISNFANPDMVGHTGSFQATAQAVEAVDMALDYVLKAATENEYLTLITADHGNSEQMINPATNKADKEHTINPVPFFWVEGYNSQAKSGDSDGLWRAISTMEPAGILADVSVSVLNNFDLKRPEFFVGEDLSRALVKV